MLSAMISLQHHVAGETDAGEAGGSREAGSCG